MANFAARFEQERLVETEFGPVVRFNVERTRYRYDEFVFVEGPTDKNFYMNTTVETEDKTKISKYACYLFRKFNEGAIYDRYTGKKSVLYCFKYIADNPKFSKDFKKCYFIMDKDYEESIDSEFEPKRKDANKRLFRTIGHSLENYLYAGDNLEKVFRYVCFGMSKEEFADKFNDFATEMTPFYAANAIITGQCNGSDQSVVSYKHKYKQDEILQFDFSKEDFWLGRTKAREEIDRMLQHLSRFAFARRFYEKKEEQIQKKHVLIRGHDAFEFIYQYVKQKANKEFNIFDRNNDYLDLLGQLTVKIENVPT